MYWNASPIHKGGLLYYCSEYTFWEKTDSLSRNYNWAGKVAQVVLLMPSKLEILSSTPKYYPPPIKREEKKRNYH
jgi:hypothetical protein